MNVNGFDEIFKEMSEKKYSFGVSEGKSSRDVNGTGDASKVTVNRGEYGDGKFSGWSGAFEQIRLFNYAFSHSIDCDDQNSNGFKSIGSNELNFYNALFWAINDTGWAYELTRISNGEMEKRTGRTRQTFDKSRKLLMDAGLIEYFSGGGGYRTSYRIVPLRMEITHSGQKYVVSDEGFKARVC